MGAVKNAVDLLDAMLNGSQHCVRSQELATNMKWSTTRVINTLRALEEVGLVEQLSSRKWRIKIERLETLYTRTREKYMEAQRALQEELDTWDI